MIITAPETVEEVWLGLIQLRARAMSQAEMARRLGISRQSICRLEAQPAPPKLRTLTGYAEVLGVQLRITYEPIGGKATRD